MTGTVSRLRVIAFGIALSLAVVLAAPAGASDAATAGRTPVVLFPAFHFTKLLVTARNQRAAAVCPGSGSFEDWFLIDHPSTTFSQVCQDKLLIEETYRANGKRRVHLVGHSNGPIYAEYLLTHTSRAWRAKYIHGFTPIAGNFPGQGSLYLGMFTGLNITDFTSPTTRENAESSARMYLSAPSTFISAADPRIFGASEVVLQDAATGRSYTTNEFDSLFTDAGLPQAREIADYYVGFLNMGSPSSFPYVDVYAEKGSGIDTVVGARLANLSVGQVVDGSTVYFTRNGDINQEDTTNNAVLAWQAMPCFHFSLTDNPGVNHFDLPANPNLLGRLVADLALPRSHCR